MGNALAAQINNLIRRETVGGAGGLDLGKDNVFRDPRPRQLYDILHSRRQIDRSRLGLAKLADPEQSAQAGAGQSQGKLKFQLL